MSRQSLSAPLAVTALPIALCLLAGSPAGAQTYDRLYSFCSKAKCSDGVYPESALIVDGSDNLYGTAFEGGAHKGGAVFKLAPNGTETVLYSFCSRAHCTDGERPVAGLISDSSGNFYGTTFRGGAHGGGTVFKLTAKGAQSVLYSFCAKSNCDDGARPLGGLVADSSGNLYGTTEFGGAEGYGAVFKLAANGTETVLYSFCAKTNCTDGAYPQAGLIRDGGGNLYSTALEGGANGYGVVFKVAANGAETVFYNFCSQINCADGANPAAGLVSDSSGNVYGTTYYGGSAGHGTVFQLALGGGETVLHNFCSETHCADGSHSYAGLLRDSSGNLYGTANDGGDKANCCGVAFKLGPSGAETVLHTFCSQSGCADGSAPAAGFAADSSGNLYSTTVEGGAHGFGTVFKITP